MGASSSTEEATRFMESKRHLFSTEEAKRFTESKRHLLSTPNVVSLAFVDEKVNGKKTGRKIFRVGVINKLPKESIIHPDVFIPKYFEHTLADRDRKVIIPVKVVEDGELVATGDRPGARAEGGLYMSPDSPAVPPYKGGLMIKNSQIPETHGCLGANAIYRGTYRLLSAAHVLTKFDRNYLGKEILVQHKHSIYVPMGVKVTDQVDVQVYESPTVNNPVRANQDLAWADITPERGSGDIIEIGEPRPIRAIVADERVKLYAGCRGYIVDDIEVTDINAQVKMCFENPAGHKRYVFFQEVCLVEDSVHVDQGDSGSAIVAESDTHLLGILFAHTKKSNCSYFCKLQP